MTTTTERAPRPVPGPARDYHFPHFERGVLPNGLRLVVAPIHRLPVATVLAVVDAGALWDPIGREGTASMVAKLLLEGAGALDGADLTEQFERIGATVESGADWDAAVVSLTVTSQHLAGAVPLFADVLRRPTFRPREIDRLKGELEACTAAERRSSDQITTATKECKDSLNDARSLARVRGDRVDKLEESARVGQVELQDAKSNLMKLKTDRPRS